jgi:hypothetical protein
MRDLLTIVGIVVFLIILVSLVSNYLKYDVEGLENEKKSKVTTSPTSILPTDVANNIQNETDKIHNLLNISTNKATYEDIVSNLSEYYDNLILLTVINAEKINNGYNLRQIAEYKMIKDALRETFEFVQSS